MDTATHFVIGLGLAGLAHMDPVVASDPTVSTAVLIGTALGSQAPDADSLLRFKGNATFVRNHRGRSHSIPAIVLWTGLITCILAALFRDIPVLHVGLWVFIAVFFHIFTDLFNAYGTQALWPFSEKWIAWNIIHIFDPVIFFAHLVAVLLWLARAASPASLFPALYAMIAVYYVWRTAVHFHIKRQIVRQDRHYESGDRYAIIPTVRLNVWNVLKRTKDGQFLCGEFRNNRLRWVDRAQQSNHPAIEASKSHPDVDAFLYFTSFACADVREHDWGYEVRWTDMRYRHRKQYPFVAVVLMDKQFHVFDSYVGWRSEERVEKKLKISAYETD